VIHRKKNDLLYKDITCLCQSLTRLWVLCLVVLFLLGLGFAPSSVLDVSSVLFSAFVHQAVVFDGSLFRTWIGCSFFLLFSFLYASFQALFQAFFFLVLLVQAHCRAASHCFCLGLSLGSSVLPSPLHGGTVHFVLHGTCICTECFFSLVSHFLLLSSSSELFCPFSHFVWLLSSHCAFPGVGDMHHSL